MWNTHVKRDRGRVWTPSPQIVLAIRDHAESIQQSPPLEIGVGSVEGYLTNFDLAWSSPRLGTPNRRDFWLRSVGNLSCKRSNGWELPNFWLWPSFLLSPTVTGQTDYLTAFLTTGLTLFELHVRFCAMTTVKLLLTVRILADLEVLEDFLLSLSASTQCSACLGTRWTL